MDNMKKAYKALRLKDAFEAIQTPVLAGDLGAIAMALFTGEPVAALAASVMGLLYAALWGAEAWCRHHMEKLGFSEIELERLDLA